MTRPWLIGGLAVLLGLTSPALAPAPARAGADGEILRFQDENATRRITMGVGKSIILELPTEAGEIFVGNPAVANAVVRSARKIYVIGQSTGQTTIYAMDKQGRRIATLELSIGRDIGELQSILRAAHSDHQDRRPHGQRFDHPDRRGRLRRGNADGAGHRQGLRRFRRQVGAPGRAWSSTP